MRLLCSPCPTAAAHAQSAYRGLSSLSAHLPRPERVRTVQRLLPGTTRAEKRDSWRRQCGELRLVDPCQQSVATVVDPQGHRLVLIHACTSAAYQRTVLCPRTSLCGTLRRTQVALIEPLNNSAATWAAVRSLPRSAGGSTRCGRCGRIEERRERTTDSGTTWSGSLVPFSSSQRAAVSSGYSAGLSDSVTNGGK